MPFTYSRRPAELADLDALVDLRLVAMRPSLEKAGRFNPARARQRFIDEFAPEHTTILLNNGELIGCYALMPRDKDLYLAHLYLLPDFQGRGIGQEIVKEQQINAAALRKDIYLTALVQSEAEQFYVRHGFRVVERGEVDIEMVWRHPLNQ